MTLLNPNRILQRVAAGAVLFVTASYPLSARDTDIYTVVPSVSRDDSPNVLLIIDNSGSMVSNNVTSKADYDPAIDYCNLAGNPGIACDRVYYSFDSNGNPPSKSSSQWFASSKNKCLDSNGAFTNAGKYASTKIAGWTGSKWKTLKDKSNSDLTYVDCEADGTNNGETAGDGTFPRKDTSAYTSTASKQFNWSNFTSSAFPILFSGNYMNYWHNTTLSSTRTRLAIAKETVKNLIDSNKSVRFGLMVFNENDDLPHGGRVLMRVDTMDDARRTTMKNIIDSLNGDTYTPLTETLFEAYRYYAGGDVMFGNASPTQSPEQDSCAQNSTHASCASGGLYQAIAAGNASYNDGKYESPFKYSCQRAYVIFMTDGDPTKDSSADASIKALSGLSTSSCAFSSDAKTSCMKDLAEWMRTHDVNTGLSGTQTVNTYTIGFGSGLSADAKWLLQQTAALGGGKYYEADSADQLISAFQGAVVEILTQSTSFTSPSLSVNAFNRLYNRDEVYFALFKPEASLRWDGNVKKFTLCTGAQESANKCTYGEVVDSTVAPAIDSSTSRIKDTSKSYWGSGTADGATVTAGGAGINIVTPRTLYTHIGTYTGFDADTPATPIAITTTSTDTFNQAVVADPTLLGLPVGSDATDINKLINWMRGLDAFDTDGDTDTTESRVVSGDWNFSDPLHSTPVAISFGGEVGGDGKPDHSKPITKLFVGSNDGMLRIINASNGKEEWAFIPKEFLANQHLLQQNADGDHVYGLDGTPTLWVNDIDGDGVIEPAGSERVYLFIGTRRGGRTLYAFDVTPTSTLTDQSTPLVPKLIWVAQGGAGDYLRLGETWSKPRVARIRAKCSGSTCDDGDPTTDDSESRMVLIFGGGYDVNQDNNVAPGADSMGNAIYIVDLFTGERLWWASSDAAATLKLDNMKYSIPSEINMVDSDNDHSIDRLYVGDTSGQIWRIDLGNQISKNNNGGSSGYVLADFGCKGGIRSNDCTATTNANRRKFFYPPDVVPVTDATYSTISNYDLVTIGSGNREDPLDLLTTNLAPVQEAVRNRLYAVRDYNYKFGPPASTPSALTDDDLYDATDNKLGTLSGVALDNEIATYKTKKGLYVDLKESSNVTLPNGLSTTWIGEKILAKTVVFGGVIFATSYVPANDTTAQATCTVSEGQARAWAIDYLTGKAVYDMDKEDAEEERFGAVGGGIPSDPVIVIREDGTSGIVGTSGGASTIPVGQDNSRYRTYWYDE